MLLVVALEVIEAVSVGEAEINNPPEAKISGSQPTVVSSLNG